MEYTYIKYHITAYPYSRPVSINVLFPFVW